jgi:hypothetical protein
MGKRVLGSLRGLLNIGKYLYKNIIKPSKQSRHSHQPAAKIPPFPAPYWLSLHPSSGWQCCFKHPFWPPQLGCPCPNLRLLSRRLRWCWLPSSSPWTIPGCMASWRARCAGYCQHRLAYGWPGDKHQFLLRRATLDLVACYTARASAWGACWRRAATGGYCGRHDPRW